MIILVISQYSSVLITNTTSREREFKIINSLGVTELQLNKLLRKEGMFFGIISMLLLITTGSGVIILFSKIAQIYNPYMEFVFPWKEMIVACILLLILSVILPSIIYRITRRNNN